MMGRWLDKLNFQESTKNEPTKPTKPTIRKKSLNVGNVGLKLVDIEKKPKLGRWLKHLTDDQKTVSEGYKKLNVGNVGSKLVKTKKSKVWCITIRSGNRVDKMNMIAPDRMNQEECKRMLIDKFGIGRLIELKERKYE